MKNTPFDRYIASARRAPHLWRIVLGVVLIGLCSVLWTLGPLGLTWLVAGADTALGLGDRLQNPVTPFATLVLLSTFLGMALGTVLAVRLLHRRSAASLFGPRGQTWREFVWGAGVVFAVYGVGLAFWMLIYTPEPNLRPIQWLLLLPLALVGVALQTGAEEMAFRGYLMQQLAARFSNPVIWMVLPALAFGAVHYDPGTAGANALLIVGSATLFGLVAADLTRQTGCLGAAWGFHFANNVVAIVVISTKGTITGLSLFQTPYAVDNADVMRSLVVSDIAMMLVAWLILRRLLRPTPHTASHA